MKTQAELAQEIFLKEKEKALSDSIQRLKDTLISLSTAGAVTSYDDTVFETDNKRYIVSENSINIIKI